MQLDQPVGSKSLIVRCGVGMFRLQKGKLYVDLTVPSEVLRFKSITSQTNRVIRSLASTLRQEVFDIPQAAAESVVQPNSVKYDFRWESKSVVQ